jgi:transcription-repair coupling factor (superfamily II helicase)
MSGSRPTRARNRGEEFPFPRLTRWAKEGSQEIHLLGLRGSSKALILALLVKESAVPLLIISPRPDDAERFSEALQFFLGPEREVLSFPPWKTTPYDEIPPHHEILDQRVRTLFETTVQKHTVIVTCIQALMQKAMSPRTLKGLTTILKVGDEINRDEFVERLVRGGYTQVPLVEERGDLSVRGGIIDLFSPSYGEPLRLEFFGDCIESIRAFDAETQRSRRRYDRVSILPAKEVMEGSDAQGFASLFDYMNPQTILAFDDLFEVKREGEAFWLQISQRFHRSIEKGRNPSEPDRWYFLPGTIESKGCNLRTLLLGEMDHPQLEGMTGETLRFAVESNDDVREDLKVAGKEETLLSPLVDRLNTWYRGGHEIIIVAHHLNQAERLQELLIDYQLTPQLSRISFSRWWEDRLTSGFPNLSPKKGKGNLIILAGDLSTGFRIPAWGLVVITEEEIFGHRRRITQALRRPQDPSITSFSELNENDYVVHIDYGIGIYRGLNRLDIEGTSNDYLLLEYSGGDKLYVPVDRINLVHKYLGFEGRGPRPIEAKDREIR